MDQSSEEKIMEIVNNSYSKVAKKLLTDTSNCCEPSVSCCSPEVEGSTVQELSIISVNNIPTLGCNTNLIEVAKISTGEKVLDLGSGPGKDTFAASILVGEKGSVIGVDFSDDMLTLANKYRDDNKITNVEFRKGNLTELPVENNSIDVIITNCVINLVPDKTKVFEEAFRVLKSGGRLIDSDISIINPLKADLINNEQLYCACIGGAVTEDDYVRNMKEVGFENIEVRRQYTTSFTIGEEAVPYASSYFIAFKP